MRIERHIQDLLFKQDCVVIPGLGGFVSHYKPAEIRKETQTFLPPGKIIGFNPELAVDDQMLLNYLIKEESVTKLEAEQSIDRFVNDVKKRLDNGERVSLEGVGYFEKLGEELEFKASQGTNFLLDSYGLSSFHFPFIEEETPSIFKRSPIFRQVEKQVREVLPGTEIKDVVTDKSFLRVAIAIPLLLILTFLPFNSRISESLFKHPASLGPLPSLTQLDTPIVHDNLIYSGNDTTVMDSIAIDSSLTTKEDLPELAVKDSMAVVDNEEVETPKIANNVHIIAGSFSSTYNARFLIHQLEQKGYHPVIVDGRSGMKRVVMTSYPTLLAAQDALSELRKQHPDLSLWVLR